jgi:hypothetical protein
MNKLILAFCLSATACAPVSIRRYNDDQFLRHKTEVSAPYDTRLVADVRQAGGMIGLKLSTASTCQKGIARVVDRTKVIERTANRPAIIGTAVVGTALIGAGAGLLAAAGTGSLHGSSSTSGSSYSCAEGGVSGACVSSVSNAGLGYGFGSVFSAAGIALIGVAIGTASRATDTHEHVGEVAVLNAESSVAISCEAHEAGSAPVMLTLGSYSADLGTSSQDGNLILKWTRVEEMLVRGAGFDAHDVIVHVGDRTARIDLSPTKAFIASVYHDKALELASLDEVDSALKWAQQAHSLGASIDDVIVAINSAPTTLDRKAKAEQKQRDEKAKIEKQIAQCLTDSYAKLKHGQYNDARSLLRDAHALGADVVKQLEHIDKVELAVVKHKVEPIFAQCRKVSAARNAFSHVSKCDAQCQSIKKKIEADWSKLSQYRLPIESMPTDLADQIKLKCQEADCPECE